MRDIGSRKSECGSGKKVQGLVAQAAKRLKKEFGSRNAEVGKKRKKEASEDEMRPLNWEEGEYICEEPKMGWELREIGSWNLDSGRQTVNGAWRTVYGRR